MEALWKEIMCAVSLCYVHYFSCGPLKMHVHSQNYTEPQRRQQGKHHERNI